MNWRTNPWLRFGLWSGGLVLSVATLMLWMSRYPLRWDLTEEKRFTLSLSTRTQLKNLQAPLQVEVYLEGELPAGFRRLRKSLQDMLQQMDKESASGLQISYIDPTAGKNRRRRQQYMLLLAQKGIQPTNLNYIEEGRSVERLVFPGLVLGYQGKEAGLMLLKGSREAGPEEILNQSIENLEYELLSGIRKLLQSEARPIGLVRGYDRIDSLRFSQLWQMLASEGYAPEHVYLRSVEAKALARLPTLLLIKPEQRFDKRALYLIDQYLIQGGQLLLFVDGLYVAADSVSESGTVALARPTGLEDLLFHYGIRISKQLLTDLYSARYPVITEQIGNQPQIRLLPWPFFPLIYNKSEHPITRNLETLLLRYASKLDTVKAESIRKTPLLWSSSKTRLLSSPVVVALDQLRRPVQPSAYKAGSHPVAYLLEGRFTSAFRARPLPEGSGRALTQGESSKILLVGDGDFLAADRHPRTGELMEIGMYLPEQTEYGNRAFLFQALDYFYDQQGIILTRNRRVKLRPLDKQKISEERSYWQWLNLLLPLVFVALLGLGKLIWRRYRYATSQLQ